MAACKVKVCRICFAMDCQLHLLHEDMKLYKAYEAVTALVLADEEDLPPYLCSSCADQLMTCARFRHRSLQAHLMLLDILKNHDHISIESIKDVIRTTDKQHTEDERTYDNIKIEIKREDISEDPIATGVCDDIKTEYIPDVRADDELVGDEAGVGSCVMETSDIVKEEVFLEVSVNDNDDDGKLGTDNEKHGEDIFPPRKTRSKHKICNTLTRRPRHKYPLYVTTHIMKHNSLDKSNNNKDRNYTYTPTDENLNDTTTADVDFNKTLDTQNNITIRNERYVPNENDFNNTRARISSNYNYTTETSNNSEMKNKTYIQNDCQYVNAMSVMDCGQNYGTETSLKLNKVKDFNSTAEIGVCLYKATDTLNNSEFKNVLTEDDCIRSTTVHMESISTIDALTTNENVDKRYITKDNYNIVTVDMDSDFKTITRQISHGSLQSSNMIAHDSNTSITQNTDMMKLTQYRENVYSRRCEGDESYNLTNNNYTMLTELLPSNGSEHNIPSVPLESTKSISTLNGNSDVPCKGYPNSTTSTIIEFNDTFHPSSKGSSSRYKENLVDPSNEAETSTRLRRRISQQHLESNDEEDVISTTNVPRKRTKDYCYFCETSVLNFARHIIRNHASEPDVQKILSYPLKSCTRKSLLTALRKRGNYIANVHKCDKPMKKNKTYPDADYLPCEKCLGFYSRKQLWKHKKKCQPASLITSNAQADAQNFMLGNLDVDEKLKNVVFPKMRADRVSLEAKKDALICAFGAQYLRVHREKKSINVTSRKMRELAKVLMELKKLKPSIDNFTDCLKPQNYDLIVSAAKKIANYDDKSGCYGAPTYAMNISTSLKQCCNIAITAALKVGLSEEIAKMEADFKALIHIIETNWKDDVSSQACSDMHFNKWTKITILPLANDLKILNEYLCNEAKIAASKLTNPDVTDTESYTLLIETIYCRVILLNRRRADELQTLLLSSYKECKNENSYEEFDVTSNAEKMLMTSFKCVVVTGKRGRGIPVLFTDDIQSDINLLINIRHKYVNVENNYLFAKPGCSTSLCGYKVLEQFAMSCGAENPKAITATKLCKHVATLTQMLNLKDSDIERFANFMGLTETMHRQKRFQDDVYQTVKISKLLLLMEGGNADIDKGKALDEIELNLDQDLLGGTSDEGEYDTSLPPEQAPDMSINSTASKPEVSLKPITKVPKEHLNKKRTIVPWTTQQKNIATKFFTKHIKARRPPKRHDCEELRSKHPGVFDNKNWLKIKVFIQNTYSKH